ncbi:GLPGLI family protein [Chryseobacterium jejuense]|uniref:GLPGLI family protein n=1 Tax=Chryseobacterium jejuense TaxID=445960 RepID=A0A2X2WVA9_CHRJE|nr:GLPGLI family protein [Chryseobacterium jejuense]SDI63069.1 GLPGLI family protein [Chryseobacterium jejuense]SQB47272.1 GLPGLI family protein [Chryseobacterium jejuense]
MRQKLLVFCMLLSVMVCYGQTIRYVYATLVNPDSINLVSMKSERTFLDIKGSRSLFISENKLVRDSLFASFKSEVKESNKKDEKSFSKLEGKRHSEPTFFEYFITKNIPEQKVYYYDKVAGKQIYYQEDRPIKWETSNTLEKQNGYSVQKAVAHFGGRIWTAWFTKDIPVSEGPYKFSGLPGLIVKLEDDKGDYKFDLVEKININNAFEEPINTEAKQSTRVNFHGDRAALELEFGKNRRIVAGSIENNGDGNTNARGGGRHGGGMNGGGMRGGNHSGGGMHRGMGGNQGFPMQGATIGDATFKNSGISQNQNPIELN